LVMLGGMVEGWVPGWCWVFFYVIWPRWELGLLLCCFGWVVLWRDCGRLEVDGGETVKGRVVREIWRT